MPSGWPADGGYLVALLPRGVVAVGVREVDMTGSDPHDLLDVPTPFADHMGVLRVGYVHLQSHLVHLGRGTQNHHLRSPSKITISNTISNPHLKSPALITISMVVSITYELSSPWSPELPESSFWLPEHWLSFHPPSHGGLDGGERVPLHRRPPEYI